MIDPNKMKYVEIKAKITEEAHKKLRILSVLKRKTQSEVIEELIMKARIPTTEWSYIIADEVPEVGVSKVSLEKIKEGEFEGKEVE